MSRTKLIEKIPDWTEFASAKRWKKQLTKISHTGELSKSTWRKSKYWMPFLLQSSKLNPDELIEEALTNNEDGEDRLLECFNYVKKILTGNSFNSLHNGVYGTLRGFYSHDKISPILNAPTITPIGTVIA